MNNTSMNFNTPFFNRDAKLASTLKKNEQNPMFIKDEMKMNSTSEDFQTFESDF